MLYYKALGADEMHYNAMDAFLSSVFKVGKRNAQDNGKVHETAETTQTWAIYKHAKSKEESM